MAEVKVAKAEQPARAMMRPFRDFFLPSRGGPFTLMKDLMDELDRSFSGSRLMEPEAEWIPAIDYKKKDGDLIVSAELPGLKKEEVKVEVTEDGLIMEGERKREETEEKEGYYRSERAYGRFYRYIRLPEEAKLDEVKAELKDGVLTVTVPMAEKKESRRQIAVQAGG